VDQGLNGNGMYLRETGGFAEGGGAIALTPRAKPRLIDRARLRRGIERAQGIDIVVDLGQRIGSREWWRGLVTCTALCAVAISLAPRFHPLAGPVPAALGETQAQEMRVSAIAPEAYGADTGKRVLPSSVLVERLADTPERPQIALTAALGAGDGFARTLERSGVGRDEAGQIADMVAGAVTLGEMRPGTKLDLTLGRRPNKQVARPIDHLAFRAKFDLALEVNRVDGKLQLKRMPIAVDNTPLRIIGRVGSSLFAAARAAGAPAKAVETYLRAMAQRVPVSAIGSNDRFDLIIEHRRAATGETETGPLLFAGLDQGKKAVKLLKWESDGREQWFDAIGAGEQRGQMKMPVVGHQTSSFGLRFHPVLGYSRMHQGIDYGAPMGSPIVAATDGTVSYSGWHGGHGNYVQLKHAGGMATGYAHMSRIIAKAGERVRAGQLIGYVGSTGLSTGPHLHFEVFKDNRPINPSGVKFTRAAQLAGAELSRFKALLARLLSVKAS
jgi:murein DD-endopeptidase MepM/ murein hydrolase activator NlpD